MRQLTASLLALLLGGAAAVALVACGEDSAQLLPGETAREITANLDTVKQLADEGDCAGAEDAARQVSEQVEALGGVDTRLQRALREGAARLSEVVADCTTETDEETVEESTPATTESTPAKPPKKTQRKPKGKGKEDAEETAKTTPATPATPPSPAETTPTTPAPPTTPGGGTGAPPGGVSPEGAVEGEG